MNIPRYLKMPRIRRFKKIARKKAILFFFFTKKDKA